MQEGTTYNAAADLIERNLAAGRGAKPAFVDDRGQYSYAEIAGRLSRFANVLRRLGVHPDEVMSRLAPIGHKHINMRGMLTFDLARYRSNLLRQAPSVAEEPRVELKKLTLSGHQRVAAHTSAQHIEINNFPDRHFWHVGYDKASLSALH